MLQISFGWTWPAFVAREKHCTRRAWKDSHAVKYKKGTVCEALDKQYRFGGRRIGVIRLTQDVVKESTLEMPDSDYEAEGFAWFDRHRETIPRTSPFRTVDSMLAEFKDWRERDEWLWTIRYDYLEIEPWAIEKLNELLTSPFKKGAGGI